MKATELLELTVKELEERIDNEKNILLKQKLNHAISPLDNPQKIKETRRNVARLMTVLRQKQLNEKSND
ncbi:MAG: 50S ribosomal protein L29 [Bacteroidales bacterium]|jgi:large subunit ribosomal protein L29|nr:50S ribosomal protein L29 [Bacteroidales bacterium]